MGERETRYGRKSDKMWEKERQDMEERVTRCGRKRDKIWKKE